LCLEDRLEQVQIHSKLHGKLLCKSRSTLVYNSKL
jgi:hypothetical protein